MNHHKISNVSEEFRTAGMFGLILKYSIPAALGSFMMTIYNIVDRIFISYKLGTEAIAGIGITFQIFMLFIAVGIMFGIGSGTLASLQLGRRNVRSAERILGTLYWIYTIGGILTCLFGLMFIDPITRLFGATDVTAPYAKEYFGILLFFMPFDFMAMGTNHIIRSEGNPRFSMWNIAAGCVANIILDYIFIFPCNMGIAGAAWATGISKLLSSILVFWHFRRSPHRSLTLRWKYFRFDKALFCRMCYIGISPFLAQGMLAIMAIVQNHTLLKYGGDIAVAVMVINASIFMLMTIPGMGIMFGYQPIIGYNYGAQLYGRVAQCLKLSVLTASGIALFLMIIVQGIAPWAFGMFCRHDAAMVQAWTPALRIFVIGVPTWAFFTLSSNFFQATGRPKITIMLSLLRMGIVMPGVIILMPYIFGLPGIWAAYPLADLMVTAITLCLIIPEYKKLRHLCSQTAN
ncbi:MAG: MATE family efflux transporter [Kiritimatiellales bacterium]